MTTSHQTTALLDQAREADRVLEGSFDINVETKGPPPLTKTIPFSERLSEQWLIERTIAQWEATFGSRPHRGDAAAHRLRCSSLIAVMEIKIGREGASEEE